MRPPDMPIRMGRPGDRDWEMLASTEPFFAVITDARYLAARLTPEGEAQFWRSGEAYVDDLASLFSLHFAQPLEPERALDFGCGVGRLLVPLARRSRSALGVDVSPTMLSLARQACERAGLSNMFFSASVPTGEAFDFVNAALVLQHISPRTGLRVLEDLLRAVAPQGLLAMHILFSRPRDGPWRRAGRWLRANVPPVHGAVNLLRGKPLRAPYMQMNTYPLNDVLLRLTASGFREAHLRLSGDQGFEVALILARRDGPPAAAL